MLNNYFEYRKNKPDYKEWENERLTKEAKRIGYLEKNGINPEASKADIERAKNVLNAVDIMDEFSQSRAEEMEMTVESVQNMVLRVGGYAGFGLAGLSAVVSKSIREAMESFLKNKGTLSPILAIPALLYVLPVMIASVVFSFFSAKQETKASRLGRAEAINKKLNSPKQFAILTDEQKNQVEEISKGITVTKKDIKQQNKTTDGTGVLKSINTIIRGDKEGEAKLQELKEKYDSDKKNAEDNKVLTNEQIEEAKKDKQLVQNVVEKIDIASQEYAEDVELATGTFSMLVLGSSGALGALTKLLLSKLKVTAATSNKVALAIGAGISIIGSIWATSIQKQASRVARYKVKQDFLSNPKKLIYVDDEKIKNETDTEIKTKKKPNFFKFLYQVYKDNQEYKRYKKEHDAEQLKRTQALEQIKLTPEQEKRAKQLQSNVIKMFNKLDEKSQTYSESTEALGEIVSTAGSLVGMIPGLLATAKSIKSKNYIAGIISVVATFIPSILLNIIVTKEQKQASKVASMMAIKELDDYRHFADYSINSNSSQDNSQISKNKMADKIIKQRLESLKHQ